MKILVTSGPAADAGKTSLVDNLFAPRIPNLIRYEIDEQSTGSAKPNVKRYPATATQDIGVMMYFTQADENTIVDVGASEYSAFLREAHIAPEFLSLIDLVGYVLTPTTKLEDVSIHIQSLCAAGASIEKFSFIMNRWPVHPGLDAMRDSMRTSCGEFLNALEGLGAKAAKTPIPTCKGLFDYLLASPTHNISSLSTDTSIYEMTKAHLSKRESIPRELIDMRLAQSQASGIVAKALDSVWAELFAGKNED